MNNRERQKNSSSDFDLDQYLDDKSSNSQTDSNENGPQKENYSWLKNSVLVFGIIILSLLYFNNWSPSLVYGSIFGAEEYQNQIVTPVPNVDESTVVIISGSNNSDAVIQVIDIPEVPNIPINEAIVVNLEGLENLEATIEKALSTAFEALEGLEALESLEALEALEGLEELGYVESINEQVVQEVFEGLGFLRPENTAENEASLVKFFAEVDELDLEDKIDDTSLLRLHRSGVSTSFLKELDEKGLLENMNSSSIINAFEIEKEN